MQQELDISFNWPELTGKELEYMQEAVSRRHLSGNGNFTALCQERLERELGAKKVLLTTSCTGALEMSAILLDIQPGDEVIVPSFTFVSGANAFVLRGAKPVFVDIRKDTLNIDENLIEARITQKTKAIVIVHYAGVACEMETLMAISKRHGVPIIEDNAHGLFGAYRGQPLGSFGTLATQSFHETKNVICGEGGALAVNESSFVERAEVLWEKGTNRKKFFAGLVDKYTWVDIGSSFLLSDLLAAFLFAQLEQAKKIQNIRHEIWSYYNSALRTQSRDLDIGLPQVPADCKHAAHLFYVLLPTQSLRDELIRFLRSRGIGSAFHYLPLHLSPMGRRFGYQEGDCPVTEDISGRLVRLPFHNSLTREEQDRVVFATMEFCAQ
ncbi:MAG TPA: dTDP-4-amino-4,6-dideoxygalactose transaminase [Chthoniobacterales bacterium]|nr:dTDP-4-amino-4,6-dideoxygalactose transaminase [Chthoniobacterales bacterium]